MSLFTTLVLSGCSCFVVILFLDAAWTRWSLSCNDKAYRQRKTLMEAAFIEPSLWGQFEAVEYKKHHTALMFRRDPYKLYSPLLLERLDPPSEVPLS